MAILLQSTLAAPTSTVATTTPPTVNITSTETDSGVAYTLSNPTRLLTRIPFFWPNGPPQIGPASKVNDCGPSILVNRLAPGVDEYDFDPTPPLAADCLVIAKNIANGGTWAVESNSQDPHQLVQYGTCAFGVRLGEGRGAQQYKVGNSDIIDIINDSVRLFQREDGMVSTKGIMDCQGVVGKASTVWWGLYRQ